MVSKIIFKEIKFYNIDFKRFNKYITKNGLFVFPAGPALALINKSSNYYQSIRKADLVFFDSGFFVLLLKVLKNIDSMRLQKRFMILLGLIIAIGMLNQLSRDSIVKIRIKDLLHIALQTILLKIF